MDWDSETRTAITKCGKLIQLVNNMAKKPAIEAALSESVDKFISHLEEDDKYLINGIFNTNFAEAALFLQSSVDLYVKKVDVLWEVMVNYQKHMITYLNENDEEEVNKVNERQEKYKRKRKRTEEEKQDAATKKKHKTPNVTDYSDQVVNYFSENHETDEALLNNWKTINETDIQKNVTDKLKGSDATLFRPIVEIRCQEDDEYTAKYNQLTLTSVLEEIFALEESGQLANLRGGISRMRIASYLVNDFRLSNNIRFEQPEHTFVDKLNGYISNFMRNKTIDEEGDLNLNIASSVDDYINFQSVPEMCVVVSNDKLSRLSSTDAIITTKSNETVSLSKSGINTLAKLSADIVLMYTKDPRICEKIRRISVGEKVALCEMQSSLYSKEKDVKSSGNVILTASESACDSLFQDCFTSDLDDDDLNDDILCMPVLEDMRTQPINCNELCCGSSVVIRKPPKLQPMVPVKSSRQLLLKTQTSEPVIKEKRPRRMSQKMIKKLITGVTVPAKSFERFYRRIYNSGDGEGCVPEDLETSDSEEELELDITDCMTDVCDEGRLSSLRRTQDSGVSDLDMVFSDTPDDDEPLNRNETVCSDLSQSNQAQTNLFSDNEQEPVDNVVPECNNNSVEEECHTVAAPEFFDGNTDLTDLEISRKNVRSWHTFIKSKLKTLESKSDFDIHEYASNLIEAVPLNETQNFGRLMRNKSSSEYVRNFTAALQLANAENIKITGVVPGQLSNDTFCITVLSKQYHHEKLKDYQAPSEETFNQRFARAQALNPRVVLHSTPVSQVQRKAYNKSHVAGRKLSY